MKKILIVVDMQKDFIDGSLGTKEAEAIVQKVKEKILSYPKEDVYATLDTHREDYLSTQGLILADHFFEKPGFGSLELANAMKALCQESKSRGQDFSIELIGLCTDICVVSNALLIKAFLPEVPLSVDSRCCAGVTKEKHEAALETLRSCQVEVL